MTIYDYDNDFAHYECDDKERSKLGQVWTPYSIIEKMMDKVDPSIWKNETKTGLDPTMGAGNIVIGMLYRRIVEYKQNPIVALKNTYGVELEPATCEYAKKRIAKFMKNFTNEDCSKIIEHNFVCSDISNGILKSGVLRRLKRSRIWKDLQNSLDRYKYKVVNSFHSSYK